tara:strand:+ start:602 stop:1015 length:414 start_codon:yes stop_codon:yes gene_type:complete
MYKLDKTEMQMLDQAIKFEDVDAMTLMFEHFDDLKTQQGYQTVWEMSDNALPLDFEIFTNKPRKVTYKCIESMGDTLDSEVTWIEFSSMAVNGSIGELWRAAESCFQQAKAAVDDWHIYVEDFQMQDDGSLQLITGS